MEKRFILQFPITTKTRKVFIEVRKRMEAIFAGSLPLIHSVVPDDQPTTGVWSSMEILIGVTMGNNPSRREFQCPPTVGGIVLYPIMYTEYFFFLDPQKGLALEPSFNWILLAMFSSPTSVPQFLQAMLPIPGCPRS